ncbi:C4-dicarboxylate ABC transporter [Accumulibacter sp.]|uniref:SLAC1 family transporter n=1 Tax=Accumulibacter sp. TaxID=2053492 RepID=UPI001A57DD6E|nr:C4-dicarboxylate ABC transporter [Accumulibacter sp.]MBL8373507.1 C4-dicarboxylate ABC transporter [Accumulibacter sp.]
MSTAPLPPLSFSEIVRNFSPGWFASVMGSGVLSLTTLALAAHWPILEALAWGLHYFNLLLFAALGVPWLARWVIHPRAALATLQHPVQASFYPTFSIAMLVIAAQFLAFGSQASLALWFWWPGATLTFILGFAVLYTMFQGEHVGLEHVTPANFIPAVGLVVIPIAGGPLVGHLAGGVRDLALLVNVVALGAGTLMYLGLLGMTLQRKYLVKPAFGILTPTAWIHLAPIGVIPVSVLNLAEQLPFAMWTGTLLFPGLLFWGFGVWWVVMAVLLTATAKRRGLLPFALSWWGFIFPLGAFVSASFRLGRASGLPGVEWVGIACWGLLLVLWLLTLAGTVRGVMSGAVFRPHP